MYSGSKKFYSVFSTRRFEKKKVSARALRIKLNSFLKRRRYFGSSDRKTRSVIYS